jgi:hypothetical protein
LTVFEFLAIVNITFAPGAAGCSQPRAVMGLLLGESQGIWVVTPFPDNLGIEMKLTSLSTNL